MPMLLLLLLLFACKKEGDDCSQYGPANITQVRYMGKSDEEKSAFFDVSCLFADGCSSINRFLGTGRGDTVAVRAEAVLNKCANCIQTPMVQTRTFVFTPSAPGTYYIKWEGLPNRTDTVHIP